jgi:hypothetical protein
VFEIVLAALIWRAVIACGSSDQRDSFHANDLAQKKWRSRSRERTTSTAKSELKNKVIDAEGNAAKLKKGAEVDVTIEADKKDINSKG